MNIIWIWDIHWVDYWNKIIEKEEGANKFIFVWDYFDSYTLSLEEQKKNFIEIAEYKRKYKDKVSLILWNHEVHYLMDDKQWGWYNTENTLEIKEILEEYIAELDVVVRVEDILFSHAWISNTWFDKIKHKINPENDIWGEINDLFFETYKSWSSDFSFFKEDNTNWDNVNQWPFRIRPKSLYTDYLDWYKQIVWHSYVARGERIIYKKKGLYFIDNFVTNFWNEKNERNYYLKARKEDDKEFKFKEIIL